MTVKLTNEVLELLALLELHSCLPKRSLALRGAEYNLAKFSIEKPFDRLEGALAGR